jgi:type IV/VI secretion system ImpK/VasF family protein
MDPETAELVYPIFRQTLQILERAHRRERLNMRTEQAELRRLFHMPAGAPGTPGDRNRADDFLGVRYPMACWVDEVFILNPESPWPDEWANDSMERALFSTAVAATRFWEQAHLAEAQADFNALEVFYLCVMLGFRGARRGDPKWLREWRASVEESIDQGRTTEWPGKPPELPVDPTDVPPRLCRQRLRWLATAWVVVVGLSIAVIAFVWTSDVLR